MGRASRVLVLAMLGLGAAEDCADGTCRADEEETAMLQKSRLQAVQSHRHTANQTAKKKIYEFCEPNAGVTCPDTGTGCAGNQCCPGTVASDYKTYPCPSAPDPAEAGCGTSEKMEDCLAPAPAPGPAALGETCGECSSTGETGPDCEEGLVCTPPQNPLTGGCPKCTVPDGNQVGENCGKSGSTGMYYGECMSGLVCAPPADAAPGAINTCANICGKFDGPTEDTSLGGCNRMQSCTCKAELPCSPWAEGAEGCYMYCC